MYINDNSSTQFMFFNKPEIMLQSSHLITKLHTSPPTLILQLTIAQFYNICD